MQRKMQLFLMGAMCALTLIFLAPNNVNAYIILPENDQPHGTANDATVYDVDGSVEYVVDFSSGIHRTWTDDDNYRSFFGVSGGYYPHLFQRIRVRYNIDNYVYKHVLIDSTMHYNFNIVNEVVHWWVRYTDGHNQYFTTTNGYHSINLEYVFRFLWWSNTRTVDFIEMDFACNGVAAMLPHYIAVDLVQFTIA